VEATPLPRATDYNVAKVLLESIIPRFGIIKDMTQTIGAISWPPKILLQPCQDIISRTVRLSWKFKGRSLGPKAL
jgi:hypothetical protein